MKNILNYNNSLVSISNSILKHFEVDTFHSTLKLLDEKLKEKEYKNVILILYDGLSSKFLDDNLKSTDLLVTNKICDISSVFPATTTAATTSLLTGLTPREHGWFGWYLYFKEINKTIETYLTTDKITHEKVADYPVAFKYLPYKSILDLINEKGKYKAYGISPFLEIKYNSYDVDDMCKKIKETCVLDGKKLIYVYFENPDHAIHTSGTKDKKIKAMIKNINNKTKKLCQSLKDSIVIITADHGLVDIEYVYLDKYSELVQTLTKVTSIEPRACTFFVKKNQYRKFEEEFNKIFKDDFILLTKKEVIEKELFGTGKKSSNFDSAIGDYLALAVSNKSIDDVTSDQPLKAGHAGFTKEEMTVPLIVIQK